MRNSLAQLLDPQAAAKLEEISRTAALPPLGLELARPLIVFDIETTGMNPYEDRIVEIGALKQHPDGRVERLEQRFNPGCPIPPTVIAIHGITDAMVRDEPTFQAKAAELLAFFSGADIGGFGVAKFDLPTLREEFKRAGLDWDVKSVNVVDALKIFHAREPRNLTAALRFYCGEELVDAHSAYADAEATFKVIAGQLRKYPDLPHSVPVLDEICNARHADKVDQDGRLRWQDNEVVINFGQKSGIPLRTLAQREPNFLRWILNKDFSDEVKAIVREALNGRFPTRGAE